MADNDEKTQESTLDQKPVDFDNSESRMSFLKGELNDMLDGINNVYGQDLMDELLKRLEKTIEDFNEEVSGLIGRLKSGKIFEEEAPEPETADPDEAAIDGEEERRGLTFEEQEEQDSDIIARMRKRISHD